jgi:hypothetical protein
MSEKIKGKFTVNEKLMILNVFKGLEHDHPQFNKTVLLSKCCEYTGRSVRTVKRVLAEEKTLAPLDDELYTSSFSIIFPQH